MALQNEVRQLKEKGNIDKAVNVQNKKAWDAAFQRAQGIFEGVRLSVKPDNPECFLYFVFFIHSRRSLMFPSPVRIPHFKLQHPVPFFLM